MKRVKLTVPDILVGTRVHAKDDIVALTDVRAAELIRLGHATAHEGDEPIVNPRHNPLGDVIEPEPPGGSNASDVDAKLPNVDDYPGLKKLEEEAVSGRVRRAAKITGRAE